MEDGAVAFYVLFEKLPAGIVFTVFDKPNGKPLSNQREPVSNGLFSYNGINAIVDEAGFSGMAEGAGYVVKAILVIPKKTPDAKPACSKSEVWTAVFTMYDALRETSGEWVPSEQVSVYNGRKQIKSVTFRVKCPVATAEAKAAEGVEVTFAEDASIYEYPDTYSKILGVATQGTKLKAIAINSDKEWVKVNKEGTKGWIDSSTIDPSKSGDIQKLAVMTE